MRCVQKDGQWLLMQSALRGHFPRPARVEAFVIAVFVNVGASFSCRIQLTDTNSEIIWWNVGSWCGGGSPSRESSVCPCGKISENVVNRFKRKKARYRTGCRVYVFRGLISNFILSEELRDENKNSYTCFTQVTQRLMFFSICFVFPSPLAPSVPSLNVLIIFQPLMSSL